MNNGLVSLNKQIPAMATGVQKLNDVYKNQIVPSTGQLKDGASKLALGLGATKEGATKLGEAATGSKAGFREA